MAVSEFVTSFRSSGRDLIEDVRGLVAEVIGLFGVVRSNAVGDVEHPLIQKVPYKDDGSGSFYFGLQQVQWMPLGRPCLDVIEVQIGNIQGVLVNLGSGKTITTFRFQRTV